MKCQNCHEPLVDPRVCRHCGTAQSPSPVETEPPAAAAAPVMEKKELPQQEPPAPAPAPEPAATGDPEPPAQQEAAAELLKAQRRAAARARLEIRNAEKRKANPPEPVPQAPEPVLPELPEEKPPVVEPKPPIAAAPVTPEPEPQSPPELPQEQPPAPDPHPPEPLPRKLPRPHEVEINDSRLGQFNAVWGKHNLLNNVYVRVGGKEEEAPEPSVFDCLVPLPHHGITDPGTTAYLTKDLRDKTSVLKRDRLLLITSSNESFLRGAAAAVIETLAIPAAQRKLLNFMAPVARGFVPTITHFLATRPDPQDEMLVVIDATSDSARQFIDSLFAIDGASSYGFIRDTLAAQHVSLICYVDSVRYSRLPARELRRFPFECWNVPYVQYLLRPYYPNDSARLEAKIAEQRKRGRWASSDFDFHEQIREQAEAGTLERVVEDGGIAADAKIPEFFPSPSQPIHMAAVYTATYFENLSPADFNRVVALLLGTRTRTETITVERKGKDGVGELVDLQRETLLVDIWRDDPDSILTECRLVTSKETHRVVSFDAAGCRDRFRPHFESRYGLFVQNQFQTIVRNELHLDSSDRVAENARLLIVDMIAASPEQFNQRWLCEVIASVDARSAHARAHTFRRIAQLLSDLWTGYSALVHGVLGDLIETRAHDAAFEIIRNLRPKPDLDDFGYIRQLLEGGDQAVQHRIGVALARDLRGPGLFATLGAMEAWLPAPDRDPDQYTRANTQALRLVLEYCIEATTQFELADYGKWPTGFPLLDVTSADKARENFALLARWLLHPGLGSVFETPVSAESATRLVAALLSEWAFILFGQAASSPAPDSGFSANDALGILLEQIVLRSGTSIHRGVLGEMLAYWEELKEILLSVANVTNDDAIRREVQWKRQVVRKLLGHFREIPRKHKTAAQMATA